MSNYKRCPVVFNMDNPMHLELYQWCMDQTTNFSDFVRSVLFAYKQNQTSGARKSTAQSVGGNGASGLKSGPATLVEPPTSDVEAMVSLL